VTSPDIAKINDLAQQLDELSDEGPAELSSIAEQLGAIAERLDAAHRQQQEMLSRRDDNMPRYLREINSIVDREIHGSRGYRAPSNEREFQRMVHEYERYRAMIREITGAMSPFAKITGV
jgi:Ni/Co efflux regulator RcnB